MAFIHCRECNAIISDRAVACPHCGCPEYTQLAKYPIPKRNFKCPVCGCTKYTAAKYMPFIIWTCDKCGDSSTVKRVSKKEEQEYRNKKLI